MNNCLGIFGVLYKSFLFRINGVEDHIHILTQLHPSVALAALIKDIKIASNLYIKEQNLFPGFTSWQEGYGDFTYSVKAKGELIEYIKNQEEHHKKVSFVEELVSLLEENEVEYGMKFLL